MIINLNWNRLITNKNYEYRQPQPKPNLLCEHYVWGLHTHSSGVHFCLNRCIRENNSGIWCTEVIWSGLKGAVLDSNKQWIVGGDFYSSKTFDYLWKSSPRGNKQVLDRTSAIGFEECLRSFDGELPPTFRNPRGGKIIHQLDHIFVTDELRLSLDSCVVGDSSKVFGEHISDHLPVISNFTDGAICN